AYAHDQRHQLFSHRRLNSRPSRTTIYAVAATLAAASVAAAVIEAGPASVSAPDAANRALGAVLSRGQHTGRSSDAPLRLSARGDIQALSGVAQPADSALRVATRAPRVGRGARRSEPVRGTAVSGTPQQIAMAMLSSFGWPSSEFSCLNSLWQRESGRNPSARNPSWGAYGIPQALPGSKM